MWSEQNWIPYFQNLYIERDWFFKKKIELGTIQKNGHEKIHVEIEFLKTKFPWDIYCVGLACINT